MGKDKLKYESHYAININVNSELESITIIQEENVPDRDAIKVEYYKEKWRTPEEYVELLKKIIIVVEKNFIKGRIK